MNKSRMKIVCFVISIVLVIMCLIGCAVSKADISDIMTTTIIPTTKATIDEPITTITSTIKPIVEKKEEETTESVQKEVIEEEEIIEEEEVIVEDYISSNYIYSPNEFKQSGVIYWGGWKWTYYSEKILPGEGLWIPGRWTDSDGYVCDENGYVCLASTSVERYSIVETPFERTGKVYDSGCAYGVMDVYVNW